MDSPPLELLRRDLLLCQQQERISSIGDCTRPRFAAVGTDLLALDLDVLHSVHPMPALACSRSKSQSGLSRSICCRSLITFSAVRFRGLNVASLLTTTTGDFSP